MILQNLSDIFLSLPAWTRAAISTTMVAAASTYAVLSMTSAKALLKKPQSNHRQPRETPIKKDFKKGVVYLYQYGRSRVIPSVSPFCLKLETWLRMADVEYENVPIPITVRSKEGTLPFVELDGVEYDDSSLIIRDLTRLLSKGGHLDERLTPNERAIGRAFEQMVENSTVQSYFFVRYLKRWSEIATEQIFGKEFVTCDKYVPGFRENFQNQFKKNLYGHGIGRHNEEDIVDIGMNDIRAVSQYLADKRYFFGDQPSRIDASLFGFLAQIIYLPIDFPQKRLVETECPNLIGYCDRIRQQYWPDWQEICETLSLSTSYRN